MERDYGFHKLKSSKEHLSCYALWKERERHQCWRGDFNLSPQIKSRYCVPSLMNVVGPVAFLRKIEAFDNTSEGGSGLFLSLLEYMIKKDPG